MKTSLKILLLLVVMIFLLLGCIQHFTHRIPEKPLKGVFTPHPNIAFSWAGWFDGSFQEVKSDYLNESFGFRNTLVRLNHQIAFSLFNSGKAASVIVGKDNFLYEEAYIDAYYGRDRIDQKTITDYLIKLKRVQDSVEKRGKLFAFVFAPGKAHFYPEYIPDRLRDSTHSGNYEFISRLMKQKEINVIDFNEYFVKMKNKTPYLLYPQYGVHWSNYGASLVFDSLMTFFENKTGADLPDYSFEYITSDSVVPPDDDLIAGMNVFFYKQHEVLPYPQIKLRYNEKLQRKLNLIVVSDSYWWSIHGKGWDAATFNDCQFWYYNKELHPDYYANREVFCNRVNYIKRLRNADIILIVNTTATLPKLNYGFADMCLEAFCSNDTVKPKILDIEEMILHDGAWLASVKTKAEKLGWTLDSILRADATWMYSEQLKKQSKK